MQSSEGIHRQRSPGLEVGPGQHLVELGLSLLLHAVDGRQLLLQQHAPEGALLLHVIHARSAVYCALLRDSSKKIPLMCW